MSGTLGGEPFTVVLPAVQEVQLPYTPAPPSSYKVVLFYYDVVNQVFGHVVSDRYPSGRPGADKDPSVWMQMAEAGQIVLYAAYPNLNTGLFDPGSNAGGAYDHRFLLRGPLDVPYGGPT